MIRWKKLFIPTTAALVAVLSGLPVSAQIPNTGDGAKSILPIMGGLLAISVVLVVVYIVLSKKKKK